MPHTLAQTLMEEFAVATGLSGNGPPRRYLWTDAFAVCNFLGLFRQTGEVRFLEFARTLVDQVHHVLGRHRDDDARRGWISGLSEEDGERHPTRGGLRIGKPLNERGPQEPPAADLEWDRDGQYFHYLTKWMHALHRLGQETGEERYQRWATELAIAAHRAFSRGTFRGGPPRLAWKMSIDLTRPLVSSTGQHDPLDGLVTCLELQTAGTDAELTRAIDELTEMCADATWATEDPLGIGGLLDDATRLGELVLKRGLERRALLEQILDAADLSLRSFGPAFLRTRDRSAERRLAFRELGLSIGLHGLQRLRTLAGRDRALATACDGLLTWLPIGAAVEAFWTAAPHRCSRTWLDHGDINAVMLATSLAPDGYLHA